MSVKLIQEGLLADKPPEQITQSDFDLIDGRLLLEDLAATDGISVDEMIDGWEAELETAPSFDTTDGVMKWLQDDPTLKPGK